MAHKDVTQRTKRKAQHMTNKKKILWHGIPSHIPTGYGKQTRLFTRALQDAGYDVTISAAFDQYSSQINDDNIMQLAAGPRIVFGNDFIHAHASKIKPDAVISIVDAYMLDLNKFGSLPWYPFIMVDSAPVAIKTVKACEYAQQPIACTETGQQLLKEAGFDPAYVPLAIETDVFKPIDRKEARKAIEQTLGIEIGSRFFAVNVAANHSDPSRKNFGALFKAWASLASQFEKPEDEIMLYCHTDICGMVSHGTPLQNVLKLYSGAASTVRFADQYTYHCGGITDHWLNLLYNAADIYVCPSRGEGFGLPLAEAQAAGCPILATAFGAMAELTECGSGIGGYMEMTIAGSEQMNIRPDLLAHVLKQCHSEDMFDRSIGPKAMAKYDIKNVMKNQMLPFVESIT